MSSAVRDRLINNAAVFDVVGERVYMIDLAQGSATPAITMILIEEEPQNSMGGEVSLVNEVWQLDCWAKTYSEATSLADSVETAMASNGVDFNAIRRDRGALFENETGLYFISLDFSLWI